MTEMFCYRPPSACGDTVDRSRNETITRTPPRLHRSVPLLARIPCLVQPSGHHEHLPLGRNQLVLRRFSPPPALQPRPPFGFDQVLGQVEAHINSLRAQLQVSPSHGTPDAVGMKPGDSMWSSPGCSQRSAPTRAGAAAAAAAAIDGAAQTTGYTETRSIHHVPRTPPVHDGNQDGLTEMEDMRLNRLLRSTNSSSSSPVGLPTPSSSSFSDKDRPLFASRSSGGGHGTSSPAVHDDGEGGSHNHSTIPSQSRSRSIQRSTAGGDEPPAQSNYPPGSATLPFGMEGVSRELFPPSPEAEAGSSRRSSCFFGGEPSRRQGVGGKGGGAGVAVAGWRVDPSREGDDLEDISDGGFHSGCWRRKYVCGEMR